MKATRRRAPGGVTILHTAIFSNVMHRNFNSMVYVTLFFIYVPLYLHVPL